MLSFAMYHILKNPHVYYRLQEEVDKVLGGEPIRKEHLGKLPYVVGASRDQVFLILSRLTKRQRSCARRCV
jgi:cytochrome P450/NADPH-cytochrome P450 reductase